MTKYNERGFAVLDIRPGMTDDELRELAHKGRRKRKLCYGDLSKVWGVFHRSN